MTDTAKQILEKYLQKRDNIQTYRHAGISDKKVSYSLTQAESLLYRKTVEKIQEILENPEIYGRNPKILKPFKEKLYIKYHYKSLPGRLCGRNRKATVDFDVSPRAILQEFGIFGEEILKEAIYMLENKENVFRREIKNKVKTDIQDRQGKEFKSPHRHAPLYQAKDNKDILNPAHVCLVHATKYFPEKNDDGQYEIKTLATATNLVNPRNTVHFALNHHVESHLAGEWDEAPYVILAPLNETNLLNNRHPVGVSLVDTFYEMDLNENLKLPSETYLIRPAGKNEKWDDGQLYKIGLHHAIYKTSEFTDRERDMLRICSASCPQNNGENSDSFYAAINKKLLLKTVLNQKGYDCTWNNDKHINIACVRMGREMGSLVATDEALHSMTLFGLNGIGDYATRCDPHSVGKISEFLHLATTTDTCFKKEGNCFKSTTQNDVFIEDFVLRKIYSLNSVGKNYLGEAQQFWKKKIDYIKKYRPEFLLTKRTRHVFNAWKEKQDKIWAEDLPKFFEKYPTFEAFEKQVQETNLTSSAFYMPQKGR